MADRAFGRLPRTYDPRIPHLSSLMAMKAPSPPPPAVDWITGMPPDWHMMLNDRLGDCTAAGIYHAMMLWSWHGRGIVLSEPDAKVEQLYRVFSPTPADDGAVEQEVLTYCYQHGAPIVEGNNGVSRLLSFHEVDVRNHADVKRVINWCGCAYIGFRVPAWMESADDISQPWDNAGKDASMVGGHCVICPGYDDTGLTVISWGTVYRITWDFWAEQVDECYACAHPWWIDGTGKTPLGLTKAELVAQMAAL